jgi:hypothetical protein
MDGGIQARRDMTANAEPFIADGETRNPHTLEAHAGPADESG